MPNKWRAGCICCFFTVRAEHILCVGCRFFLFAAEHLVEQKSVLDCCRISRNFTKKEVNKDTQWEVSSRLACYPTYDAGTRWLRRVCAHCAWCMVSIMSPKRKCYVLYIYICICIMCTHSNNNKRSSNKRKGGACVLVCVIVTRICHTTHWPFSVLEIWLILPVVICLFQGLSHACLRITALAGVCAWLITSDVICRKSFAVSAILDNLAKRQANTWTNRACPAPRQEALQPTVATGRPANERN